LTADELAKTLEVIAPMKLGIGPIVWKKTKPAGIWKALYKDMKFPARNLNICM
jgi:hypothetical protein